MEETSTRSWWVAQAKGGLISSSDCSQAVDDDDNIKSTTYGTSQKEYRNNDTDVTDYNAIIKIEAFGIPQWLLQMWANRET